MLSLVKTADGSTTVFNAVVGEHYHSKHGAVQESRHVFLHAGLLYYLQNQHVNEVNILEVGLGTGLNFLLTAEYCTETHISLNYTGIEAYPLAKQLIRETGYQEYVSQNLWNQFLQEYEQSVNERTAINPYCQLKTAHCRLENFESHEQYDVLYFDAFAAIHQPEMWEHTSLKHITQFLKPGGIFVTYAITGNLKRSMKALGFTIQKVPGAPGKREMLRAIKQSNR